MDEVGEVRECVSTFFVEIGNSRRGITFAQVMQGRACTIRPCNGKNAQSTIIDITQKMDNAVNFSTPEKV